jgi:hypothetical protein
MLIRDLTAGQNGENHSRIRLPAALFGLDPVRGGVNTVQFLAGDVQGVHP